MKSTRKKRSTAFDSDMSIRSPRWKSFKKGTSMYYPGMILLIVTVACYIIRYGMHIFSRITLARARVKKQPNAAGRTKTTVYRAT